MYLFYLYPLELGKKWLIFNIQNLKIILTLRRYNEEMINQTIPEGQEERDELILYTLDLEKELRNVISFILRLITSLHPGFLGIFFRRTFGICRPNRMCTRANYCRNKYHFILSPSGKTKHCSHINLLL